MYFYTQNANIDMYFYTQNVNIDHCITAQKKLGEKEHQS